MGRPSKKHIHKYRKVKPNKNNPDWVIYKCDLPGCTHYIHGEILILGKQSICFLCEQPFIMNVRSLRVKPECNVCLGIEPDPNVKSEEKASDINAILDEVMKKVGR